MKAICTEKSRKFFEIRNYEYECVFFGDEEKNAIVLSVSNSQKKIIVRYMIQKEELKWFLHVVSQDQRGSAIFINNPVFYEIGEDLNTAKAALVKKVLQKAEKQSSLKIDLLSLEKSLETELNSFNLE